MKKIYFFLATYIFLSNANAQIVTIPDVNFKTKLLSSDTFNTIAKNLSGNYFKIDANNDGEIQLTEAAQVSYLFVYNSNIHSLEGILSFTNIHGLNCSGNLLTAIDLNGLNVTELQCYNNQFTSLNVTYLINLDYLDCKQNQLTSLNINGLPHLRYLACGNNNLAELNISGLTTLREIYCSFNHISTLDLNGLDLLQNLECNNNELTVLDVSNKPVLQILNCHGNHIPSLDLSDSPFLSSLLCAGNQLESLDLSASPNLSLLVCTNNQITFLDLNHSNYLSTMDCGFNPLEVLLIKNNYSDFFNYRFENCPTLRYVCVDDSKLPIILNKITSYGYTNCHANSYCTFDPTGTFYTVQGTCRYDYNNNGCDPSDLVFTNVSISIVTGPNAGTVISDTLGNYHYDMQSGNYTLNASIENPSYFTILPSSATVNFPTATSPFTQDFCILANGVHNDLEIVVLPIVRARPGFDAVYKIICKNKGTAAQNATVNFMFDDNVLDLVNAIPNVDSQTSNNLSWNLSNLLPFETREVTVTLNVNSPTEIPAVNNGDILHYIASISGLTDETPNDNTSLLNQVVVNSLDPNDKTCMEGNVVSPDMVGNYVHYMIRFENTGTANAENIVVKDVIDTTKFDLNSLVPLSSSHSFVTRILGANKVEFIFENINLPFDNANNDGYVAFKIKTKSTLFVGDTFSNSANIYFDYNFPIVTNTATTIIQTLGTHDFEFGSIFSLSPVPTKNTLTITTKQDVEISSLNIYNTLGQLVQINTNPGESIDVSDLKTGNYFIKIVTDKGTSSSKFIKE